MRVVIALLITLGLAAAAQSAMVEVPEPNQTMSGVSFFAGWKCDQGTLTGSVDGGPRFPLAGLMQRADTGEVCKDTNNGWIAQFNFNRLSPGTHTFEAFDGALSFAAVQFEVVHFGEEFKRGVTGEGVASLSDGSTADLTWAQNLQAFVVTGTGSDPYSAVVDAVIFVIDGDTFRVDIRGWPAVAGENIPVRVYGVDTPEIWGQCDEEKERAVQAREYTEELLFQARHIELYNLDRDKYFRLVADVEIDGLDLTSALIESGHGRPYSGGTRLGWCEGQGE